MKSGNGGDGKHSFKRTRIITSGNPNGGDGGSGGDMYFSADPALYPNLVSLLNKKEFRGLDGKNGRVNKNGKSGKKLNIQLPLKCKI